jgi:putative membrane protein
VLRDNQEIIMRAAILSALVVCLASVAYAHGNGKDSTNGTQSSSKSTNQTKGESKNMAPLGAAETQVINGLHEANMTEVAAGKLAEKNGVSAAVKRYGRMLVKDHTAADRKLSSLAARRGLTMTGQGQDLSSLQTRKGADFDSAFISEMIKGHNDAIAMVKHAQDTCNDKEVKTLLDQTLPVLQHHQSEAVKLQQQAYAQ